MPKDNPTSEIGKQYGRWTVLAFVRADRKHVYWECVCSCGTRRVIVQNNLRRGLTHSCGCLSLELHTRHGQAGTAIYKLWQGMIRRCTKESHPSFSRYSSRGITVCARWAESFAAFFEDVGVRPEKHLTLERIDNDKGYEPGNVRWATRAEQNRNMSSNVFYEFRGERLILPDWAKRLGVSLGALQHRVKSGWSVERMLTEPVKSRPSRG